MPTLPNPTRPVNFLSDPWLLLTVCDALDDASFFRERFYSLVAQRSTRLERNHLIAKGLGCGLGYTLRDALDAVEVRILDRMMARS